MAHTLEADSIYLEFDTRRILSDIYIKAETGKITGLLARNGQGKTCLLNIIYGNLNPQSRSVRFDGVHTINAFKRIDFLSYLPQFSFIPQSLTIKDVFKDFETDFALFASYFIDFEDLYKASFSNLSGGQKRLIEVYCLIKTKSLFSMLDEPFSHIMPVHVETIKEILSLEKQHKGFIITDHLFRHITEISDSLYVLKDCKTYLTKSLEDIEELGYAHL
jgi:lipopolysaccharide export system ATP-binding protein